MTHIWVSKLNIIGSDNGLSPGRHQAIIWTNAGILLIWPKEPDFSEILIEIHIFSFKKMHLNDICLHYFNFEYLKSVVIDFTFTEPMSHNKPDVT